MRTPYGWLLGCVLLATVAQAAPAAPPDVKTPQSGVNVAVGRATQLRVETDGVNVMWIGPDDAKVDLFPFPDGKSAVFATATPGSYTIWVVAASDKGEMTKAKMLVNVTGGPIIPPGPGPGPGPNPPQPDDALTAAVKAAYALEADLNKIVLVQQLASSYQAGLDAVNAATTYNDVFLAAAKKAEQLSLTSDKLVKLRTLFQAELKRVVPAKTDTPLDAAGKTKLKDTFEHIIAALKALE